MVLFRCFLAVAALFLFGASASALTMQECRAQYKTDHAAGTRMLSWVDYQKKRCGIDPNSAAPARTEKPLKG
jgi:hypothetical protein